MIKHIFRTFAILIGLTSLSGCGKVIEEGEVYAKAYVPAHQIEVDDTIYTQIGDITVPIVSSHMENVPDRWYIAFKKIDEESKSWLTRELEVTKETYDGYAEGDYISFKQN